jgi:beta-phosphoglucomutase
MYSILQAYDFIVFDLDGLLVNTELLHFQAYKKMCSDRGFFLPWDFTLYSSFAHTSSDGIKKGIYAALPKLYQSAPHWDELYAEKKKAYKEFLLSGQVALMPGVDSVLCFLQKAKIPSCIVTNSFREQVEIIYEKIPSLQAISFQVAREDYKDPKPSPDAYVTALKKYAKAGDRVIGFEDTVRGWRALLGAGIDATVISAVLDEETKRQIIAANTKVYSSFEEIASL